MITQLITIAEKERQKLGTVKLPYVELQNDAKYIVEKLDSHLGWVDKVIKHPISLDVKKSC